MGFRRSPQKGDSIESQRLRIDSRCRLYSAGRIEVLRPSDPRPRLHRYGRVSDAGLRPSELRTTFAPRRFLGIAMTKAYASAVDAGMGCNPH